MTGTIPAPEPELTQEAIIQRARDMVPTLRARQEETEELGRLPDVTSRELIDAGFYRILQPRRFGGYEFDLPTFSRVAIQLARGCPSTGWAFTLTAGHAHLLASYFSEDAQVEIAGTDGDIRVPGRFRPGTAVEVDGGYRCTGTFDYVSGCDSATYLTFGFALDDDLTAGELATDIITLIPFDQVEIVHNWDVLGLRGTGSNRVIVDDVFVPSHMTIHSFFDPQAPPFPGRTVHENPTYRRGSLAGLVFAETCSVAIGAARGVLDLFEESIRTRRTTVLPLVPMTEHGQYPRFYGEALQGIEVAEAALLQTNADYMAEARRADDEDRDFDPDLDRRLQLRMQLCAKMAYDAVLLMMRVNGSAGMRTGAMWQRYLRDMNVLMTHNTVQPELVSDFYGRLHFGLMPYGAEALVPQAR
jgi:3-hydroxy-9,10-secoandrosta-1,3,5(10)-triene-9,17-dione monooxygenase